MRLFVYLWSGGSQESCWFSVCIEILKTLVRILVKERHSNSVDETTIEGEGTQAKKLSLSFMLFYLGCHQKALPRIKIDLPASNSLQECPAVWVFLNPYIVKLTTKISHHTIQNRNIYYQELL